MESQVMNEGRLIIDTLHCNIEKMWDGKCCLLKLKDANYQWRQMEWIGWYFEYAAKMVTTEKIGGSIGVRINNTTLDYRRNFHWDFKAHISNSTSKDWTILNDREAIETLITYHGGLGYIICSGDATYNDLDCSFKMFHDQLKGKTSKYEQERVSRGASSRRRKTAFKINSYTAIFFDDLSVISEGFTGGWLGSFQENMRNSNGSPRREKLKIHLDRIPEEIKVFEQKIF